MGKLILSLSYFAILPIVIAVSILFVLSLPPQNNPSGLFNTKPSVIYAALPSTQDSYSISNEQFAEEDARTEIVRQFFGRYSSPLEPYAKDIITKADEYGLDFRLLPAIAMQESYLCQQEPEGSFNCWGYGIYGGKVRTFDGYSNAIDVITKTLAIKYKKQGLSSPEEIVTLYTPRDNGKWVNAIYYFMDQLR